ncbi:hypothetical protein O181_054847 [Austropuccinia psidii MF-1]|uniref:Uncharacterized protein n=1 Tax=Austropuccinia psidii MF-1 TaxID=1389203 RepID=A0A9Q3ECG3_9BASI|nr:hypothetical protein [Austropuccinia psidii MF-1]
MLGWQNETPRGIEIKEWFVKGKSKRFNNEASSSRKDSFKLKKKRRASDLKNLEDPDKGKILATKNEEMEHGEMIEELEKGKILETKEPEQGLSSGIILNQVQDEKEKNN